MHCQFESASRLVVRQDVAEVAIDGHLAADVWVDGRVAYPCAVVRALAHEVVLHAVCPGREVA